MGGRQEPRDLGIPSSHPLIRAVSETENLGTIRPPGRPAKSDKPGADVRIRLRHKALGQRLRLVEPLGVAQGHDVVGPPDWVDRIEVEHAARRFHRFCEPAGKQRHHGAHQQAHRVERIDVHQPRRERRCGVRLPAQPAEHMGIQLKRHDLLGESL